ncbi:MAG: selenocysteine-specific translation elongation factor, partial [Candidatus Eisenbacteria bacterium]|nr:selenocysteine-specific translation elongation factor [Candidatus Eisenbacteria bacterium]
VDTDRLKEEKKRGISIELGFASLELPSGRRCGVVDVPGHERFIRNMLAGAGGIDLIVLVIAADEGVMPQTREHLDIIQLLGVDRGVVALTKVDLVDADWLELVQADVHDYLSRTTLKDAPIMPVSSVTGEGREALLARIDQELDELDMVQRGRFVRLPVDRVFTMEGFGTVVTGTLWGGSLDEGGKVRVEPRGLESRIKTLQVHNQHVPQALPGQRVAVCLHNVGRDEVERGDWLVPSNELRPVTKLDVRLRAIDDLPKVIRHRSRIRFYLGASELMGRLVLLESEELKAGEATLAQVQLDEPVVAERGDRFVIRSYSPMRTLGGGMVLDVSGTRRRRYRKEDLAALRLVEEGTLDDRVHATVRAARGVGVLEVDLTQSIGQPPAEIRASVEQLLGENRLRRVGRSRLVAVDAFEEAGRTLEEAILAYEKANRLRFGPQKSEIKSRHSRAIHGEVAEAWFQQELEAGHLWVRGDQVRRSNEAPKLTPEMQALRTRMLDALADVGFSGPTQKAFLEEIKTKGADELLALLLSNQEIVRLPSDILLHAERVQELRGHAQSYFAEHAEMNIGALKDMLGVSRKNGVPLLEFMDQQGWTERHGDVRIAGSRLKGGEDS